MVGHVDSARSELEPIKLEHAVCSRIDVDRSDFEEGPFRVSAASYSTDIEKTL